MLIMLTVYYQEKTKIFLTCLTKDGIKGYKYSFKKLLTKYMVKEDGLTIDGGDTMQYTDHVS